MGVKRWQRWQARRMVRRNMALASGLDLEGGRERLAARYLFGLLADLEEIAVLAAERGDGIRNQLRDELAHRDTFAAIAEDLGGKPATPPEVVALTDYLQGQQGPASLACLNIVAEHWLGGVFEAVATFGLADALFTVIGQEEARHVQDALKAARPDPEEAVQIVRDLEFHLAAVATCPAFLLPLATLGGDEAVAAIGLRNVADHWTACAALGVQPGPDIRTIEATCRAALLVSSSKPKRLTLNGWQESRFNLWPDSPAPMVAFIDVEPRGPRDSQAELEARLVQAVGAVLARYPELNVTVRAGHLYRPKSVEVGVRRLRSKDEVITVHVRRPHSLNRYEVVELLDRRVNRLRAKPYKGIPYVARELWELLPPSRCAAVVTNTSSLGASFYLAPLSDLEGSPISVTVGAATNNGYRLGIQMDHRAGDGRHVGQLAQALSGELKRV